MSRKVSPQQVGGGEYLITIPRSLQTEHEEVHIALVEATRAPGRVGAAAKELGAVRAGIAHEPDPVDLGANVYQDRSPTRRAHHKLKGCSLMSDNPHEPHRRPHSPSMADPFMEFDLAGEVHRLKAETTWSTGQNARTLVKYDDLRVVLTALQPNERIPEHKTEGRISIHVLSGHIQVKASGRTFNLRNGALLALDRAMPHEVEALEESAFVLTIAWPGRE